MTRSSSRRGWKIVLGIIAAILVLFFIAEMAVRGFTSHQIKSAIRDSAPETVAVQEDARVSFGPSPVIFGLLRQKLNHINIDVPSTLTPDRETIVGTPAANIDARGVVLDSEDPRADNVVLSTDLPKQFVRDMLQSELDKALTENNDGRFSEFDGILTVSTVETNAMNGTFTITFSNGAFGVELRPDVDVDGQPSFSAVSTQILGHNLPDVFSEAVTSALTSGINEGFVGPLRVREFTVIDAGLHIVLEGEQVHLNDVSS